MASITLSPAGTQLDNDEIADIQVKEGDRFNASFELDTSNLDANLQTLIVRGDQDFAEVDFTATRNDFDSTAFPDFNIVETSTNDNFTSIVFEATGPGAAPDTVNVLVEGEITVLEGLKNDGQPDFGITVIQAIDANGNDVTDLFESANQAIEVQPLPTVSIEIEPTLVVEGESQAFVFKLSEPAPTGGLVVDVLLTNPDGEVDIVPGPEPMQNVTDARSRTEDGRRIDQLTIAEGATEASLNFVALEDNVVEGNESFSITLLPRDGYIVDANNNIADSVIVDADTAIDGTENAEAISAHGENDSLFGDDSLDTLIGGTGNDILVGKENEDCLIGVEQDSTQPGLNEQDTLTGDLGSDSFILGNEAGFYSDGDTDLAAIADFNLHEDKIQLFGSAEQYSL